MSLVGTCRRVPAVVLPLFGPCLGLVSPRPQPPAIVWGLFSACFLARCLRLVSDRLSGRVPLYRWGSVNTHAKRCAAVAAAAPRLKWRFRGDLSPCSPSRDVNTSTCNETGTSATGLQVGGGMTYPSFLRFGPDARNRLKTSCYRVGQLTIRAVVRVGMTWGRVISCPGGVGVECGRGGRLRPFSRSSLVPQRSIRCFPWKSCVSGGLNHPITEGCRTRIRVSCPEGWRGRVRANGVTYPAFSCVRFRRPTNWEVPIVTRKERSVGI